MALFHQAICRLTLSNIFLPYKSICSNRISSCSSLWKLSVEEKLGLKPKPKRPKSSFLVFISQIKPQILQDNPKVTITEINKIASEKWRELDEKTKEKMSEGFKVEWNRYVEEMKAYDSSLSPEHRRLVDEANNKISQTKKKKNKKMTELGKPKKPPTMYLAYMLSKLHERGDQPYREWQQKVIKEWELMDESIKQKLHDNYAKEMDRYKKELAQWELKMQKHQDLVRTSGSS